MGEVVANRRGDQAGAACAILAGAGSCAEGFRLYPLRTSWITGDHTMPLLLGIGLVIMGLVLLFGSSKDSFSVDVPAKHVKKVMAGIFAVIILYAVLIPLAGYLLSTWLACVFLFRLVGAVGWLKSVVRAVMLAIVLEVVFVYWLQMSFPTGLFGI